MEEELTARERTVTPQPRPCNERPPRSTTTTLLSGAQAGPTCSYCQQFHAPTEYTTIMDVKERKDILKSSGRCFNCLRCGHVAGKCRSQNHCQICKRKHHTSICERSETQTPTSVRPPPVTSVLNPEAPPFESTPTTSAQCANDMKTILLLMARARVYNLSAHQSTAEMRVLLDCGSQRSYIISLSKLSNS